MGCVNGLTGPLTAALYTFFFSSFIVVLCHIFAVFWLWDQLYREKKYIKISCRSILCLLFSIFYQMRPTLV